MKNLIKQNYKSTVKRGKIKRNTDHSEFLCKLTEEVKEFDFEVNEISCFDVNNYAPKKAAIEMTDIILVGLNYLVHYGFDPIELMEEKIRFNEQRID